MLTIFSTTRRFQGLFDVIQTNALTSWTELEPRPQILIFGDDEGTAEACRRLGLTHVPDIELSELGTPLVSAMIERAEELADFDTLCMVNSDIILFDELLDVARTAHERFRSGYLVVGQRYDLDVPDLLSFDGGWRERLLAQVGREGKLHSEIGLDYFIFRKGLYPEVPPFAIGRTSYDNWLVWKAGDLGASVIDATRAMTVVHQNHDYSHGGGLKAVWEGPEARRAQELIGHWSRAHAVAHARFMFTAGGDIVPAKGMKYRLARPRRVASHLLRFTRPFRRRLWAFRYELRTHAGSDVPVPGWVDRVVAGVGGRVARTTPGRIPGYESSQVVVRRGARLRLGIWALGRFLRLEQPVTVPWIDGLEVGAWLGNDLSRSLFVGGTFEPNEVTFFRDLIEPGMVVVDAGANEGLYSLVAANRVGPTGTVVAVEPSSRERTRLRSNLARGAYANVRVAAVALDDHPGDVALHLADPHHAGQNTLGAFVYDGVGHAGDEVVPATTLDALVEDLGLAHVDALKIDVEGAEVRLLDGAAKVLRQHRPILLLEWQGPSLERQGSSIVELGGRLAAAGYVVLPFDERTGRPTAGRAPTDDDANVVACHRDRLDDLVARDLALPGAAVTNVEHAS